MCVSFMHVNHLHMKKKFLLDIKWVKEVLILSSIQLPAFFIWQGNIERLIQSDWLCLSCSTSVRCLCWIRASRQWQLKFEICKMRDTEKIRDDSVLLQLKSKTSVIFYSNEFYIYRYIWSNYAGNLNLRYVCLRRNKNWYPNPYISDICNIMSNIFSRYVFQLVDCLLNA